MMKKPNAKKKDKIVGLPPGSIVFTGNRKVENVHVHYLNYDAKQFQEKTYDSHEKLIIHLSADEEVDWYDLRGLHDTSLIEALGKGFNIHPLILEDVADVNQRPKYEEYESGNFISLKALSFDRETYQVKKEQVAFYFRTGLVLTFQETASDLFQIVRQRLYSGRGRIRERGADYLVYAIIDALVDHYFIDQEDIQLAITDIESQLLDDPSENVKARIHLLKKQLLQIRKSIAPLREAMSRFARSESSFIDPKTSIFIRDLYDHTIQVMDMVDSFRDMLNGLQDLYLSEISFKMNQVMQVLTIITSIFVPLSFLAGLYGMNFDHMPELHFRYGYFILLGVMLLIFVGSIIFFKQKKWF